MSCDTTQIVRSSQRPKRSEGRHSMTDVSLLGEVLLRLEKARKRIHINSDSSNDTQLSFVVLVKLCTRRWRATSHSILKYATVKSDNRSDEATRPQEYAPLGSRV
eukprot:6485275-Amphidinium_carterae.1